LSANLHDKVVVVTGANRGIGLATVCELLRRGARVVAGVRDPERMPELSEGAPDVRVLDVTDASSCRALVDAVLERHGRIDGLVNSAGILPDDGMTALDLDEATLRATLETNVLGVWRMCQLVLPPMLTAGCGRIVNLTSGWGAMHAIAAPGTPPAYGLSKLAVNAITQQLAAAVGTDVDVRVNALDPGWVRTDMGGDQATRDPAEPAREIADFLGADVDIPNGVWFRRGRVVDW
jgi:NAD(P)-dependent dehydrogenase (short-subunit alcohol dehydrogenase family)